MRSIAQGQKLLADQPPNRRSAKGNGDQTSRNWRTPNLPINLREDRATMACVTVLAILFLGLAGARAQECTDVSPDTMACPELIAVGTSLCNEDFFIRQNYCAKSCGRSPCPSVSLELQQGGDVKLIGKVTGERKKEGEGAKPVIAVPAPTPVPAAVPPATQPVEKPETVAPTTTDTTSSQAEQLATTQTEPGTMTAVETPEKVTTPTEGVTTEAGVTTEVTTTTEPGAIVETPEGTTTEAPVEAAALVEEVPMEFAPVDGCQTPAGFIAERDDMSLLLKALKASGLIDSLNSADLEATLFLPTNGAFRSLLSQLELSEDKFFEGNPEIIKQLLQLHVSPGAVRFSGGWQAGEKVPTLLGGEQMLEVKTDGGVTIVSPAGPGAQISEPDKKACKAVIHVINNVLIPAPVVDLQALFG